MGGRSVCDRSVHPPRVHKLHLHFVGWRGSDLVECFPAFAVTQQLADALLFSTCTGFVLREVELTVDEQLTELYPDLPIPGFLWLQVVGVAGADDFGLDDSHSLIVSGRALEVLQRKRLVDCEVELHSSG